jgi:hypothetical protein
VALAGGQTPLLRPADAAQAEPPAAERQAAEPAEAPAAMDIDGGVVHAELSAAPPLAAPEAELVQQSELAPLDSVAGAMAAAGALSEQLGGGGGEDSGSEGNAPHLSGSPVHRAVAAVDAQVEQLEALSGPQDKPISTDGPAAATSAACAATVPVAPAAAPGQAPVPRLQQQQLLQDEEQQRLEAVVGESPQEQAPEQQRRRQSGGGGSISGKRRLGALRGSASQVTRSALACLPACLQELPPCCDRRLLAGRLALGGSPVCLCCLSVAVEVGLARAWLSHPLIACSRQYQSVPVSGLRAHKGIAKWLPITGRSTAPAFPAG